MADDRNSSVASLIANVASTASRNSPPQDGSRWKGVHVVVHVSTASSTGINLTPKVQGWDPASGGSSGAESTAARWYDVLSGTAITSTGTTVLKVYPGIAASAGAAASDVLPPTWRVRIVHASTKDAHYTVAAHRID